MKLGLAALVVVAGLVGGGGYVVGRAGGADLGKARSSAAALGAARGETRGALRGHGLGFSSGRSAGFHANYSHAYRRAYHATYARTLRAATQTANAPAPSGPAPTPGPAQSAARQQRASPSRPPGGQCVPVGNGVCNGPGPATTGHPCPPGSVPNADGGVVCVGRSR